MRYLTLFALALVVLSCNSGGGGSAPVLKLGTDTVLVSARQADNTVFIDSAIRTVSRALIPKDSNSTEGVWGVKPSYRLGQLAVKMNGKDTVFNKAHQPVYILYYSQFPVDDSLMKYVTVISIPMHYVKPATSSIIFHADKVVLDTPKK
jgi:hypothetical protein